MKTSLELERREKQISKWKIWIRKKHQPKMKMPLHRTKCQSAKTSPQAVIITLFQRTQVNPIIRTTKVSFIQSITQITDQNPKIQLETPNRIMEPVKPTTRKPELSTKGSSRNNVTKPKHSITHYPLSTNHGASININSNDNSSSPRIHIKYQVKHPLVNASAVHTLHKLYWVAVRINKSINLLNRQKIRQLT